MQKRDRIVSELALALAVAAPMWAVGQPPPGPAPVTPSAAFESRGVLAALISRPAAGRSLAAAGLDDPGQGPDQDASERDQQERDREQAQRDREQEQRDREQARRDREQEQRDRSQAYDEGTEALDEHKWDKAISKFSAVADRHSSRADGALYWKAYAENKLARRAEALTTLGELRKQYPNSRWLDDAKALELEVRQSSGQNVSPDSESNEDLKLMALQALMNSRPEQAMPLLKKVLEGAQPLPVKERALFVLSQNGSPQARSIIAEIARGKANPDLQRKALEDLGLFGGKESRQTLADIYASSNDPEIKRTILHSFMIGGDRDRVLAAAKGEKDPDLRRDAIHQLGIMGAQSELSELYSKDASVDDKRAMLQAMFIGGSADKLTEVAKSEKNPELRVDAIHDMGLMGGRTADGLLAIYASDKDRSVRRAVIQALFLQANSKALVALARKETDPELKRNIVQQLSVMGGSKDVTDYMMELLNK